MAWRGLSPDQAVWLSRLAVFSGAFDAELASWALEGWAPSAIAAVDSLVAAAVVHPVSRSGGRPALRLMPVIRRRALEELGEPLDVYRSVARALLALGKVDEESLVLLGDEAGSLRVNELWEVANDAVLALEEKHPDTARALGLVAAVVSRWFRSPLEIAHAFGRVGSLVAGLPIAPAVELERRRALQRTGRLVSLEGVACDTLIARAHYAHVMAVFQFDQREYAAGLVHASAMTAAGNALGNPILAAMGEIAAAQLHRLAGDLALADGCVERAMPVLWPLPFQKVVLNYHLVQIRSEQGRLSEAADASRQAIADARSLGLRWMLRSHQAAFGYVLERQGDLAGVVDVYTEAGEGFRADGGRYSMIACFANAGAAMVALGDVQDARALLTKALRPPLPAGLSVHFTRLILACAMAELGELDEARALVEASRPSLSQVGDPGNQIAIADAFLATFAGRSVAADVAQRFEPSLLRTALERVSVPD
jgi:tetratricopeptide (TPR) repeat protein